MNKLKSAAGKVAMSNAVAKQFGRGEKKNFIQCVRGGDVSVLLDAPRLVECIVQMESLEYGMVNAWYLDVFDKYGQTAISAAAEMGLPEFAEKLLFQGAKTEIADNRGRTPFFWACEKGNIEVLIQC